MNKDEFKKILKPLVKECIKEVVFEDGTLSSIITEVVQGLQGNTQQPIVEKKIINSTQPTAAIIAARNSLEETKKELQNSTGLRGIFEGTTPMRSANTGNKSNHGPLRGVDPSDPGVDISGIMKIAGGGWNQIK